MLKKKIINKKKLFLIIDGDIFRKKTNQSIFTKKNIIKNNLAVIKHCKLNFYKYDYILVSVIAPLEKTRLFASKQFNDMYFEILLYAKIKTLIKRDTKGLYNEAKKGNIKNLIGYKSKIKYEKSNHAHLKLKTEKNTKKKCIDRIMKYTSL